MKQATNRNRIWAAFQVPGLGPSTALEDEVAKILFFWTGRGKAGEVYEREGAKNTFSSLAPRDLGYLMKPSDDIRDEWNRLTRNSYIVIRNLKQYLFLLTINWEQSHNLFPKSGNLVDILGGVTINLEQCSSRIDANYPTSGLLKICAVWTVELYGCTKRPWLYGMQTSARKSGSVSGVSRGHKKNSWFLGFRNLYCKLQIEDYAIKPEYVSKTYDDEQQYEAAK